MSLTPTLQSLLECGRPVLTDGAWGTQFQARGLPPGQAPDHWNLTHPDRVIEVARAYVEAGSDIILTNTFGANRLRLADAAVADQVVAINEAGARLSREAAAGRALVFASIGPSGRMLLTGDVSEKELKVAFTEQAQALARGGADALVVETMSELDEARIAIAAAKGTGLPVAACMVFDSGADRDRTMMGTTPEEAAEGLLEAGADIIGANCGQGIAGFVAICERLRAAAREKPVWIKANAGLPEMRDGKAHYAMTAEEFASYAPSLRQAGAAFIGGCCGTTPDFIRALRAVLVPEG